MKGSLKRCYELDIAHHGFTKLSSSMSNMNWWEAKWVKRKRWKKRNWLVRTHAFIIPCT